MKTTAGRTTIFIVALLAAGVVALVGCSNSSGPSGSAYLAPTSPENVLANVQRAYVYRNLDEYLDCLSEDFKFHFSEEDQQDWPQFPPWFYKSDESQVHENMFDEEGIVESITLTLTTASVETIPGGDSGRRTGDTVVMLVNTDLRVNLDGDVTYLATTPQEFRFREVAGSREPGGRALWEMFEWHDLEEPGGSARVEEPSWGTIKHHFLESLSEPSRRISPAEVIDQLRTAYIFMNPTDYLDCLSEDFAFYPNEADVADPQQEIPPVWYKSDEQVMHENMFAEDSNVESISLTLTVVTIEYDGGVPDDPLDDTCVCVVDVDLRVNLYADLTYLVTAPSEFNMCVDQDDEGPYGEIMWDICAWYDLGEQGRGGGSGRVVDATWGSVKAMYR